MHNFFHMRITFVFSKKVLRSVYFIISSKLHHYLTGAYVKFKAYNHYFEINDRLIDVLLV